MGNSVSSAMGKTMRESQDDMMRRQIELQLRMRDNMMAFQIATARERMLWVGAFYGVICVLLPIRAVKTRNPAWMSPLLPLGFVTGYQYDFAYGTKLERINDEARRILEEERARIDLPEGAPTLEEIKDRAASRSGRT